MVVRYHGGNNAGHTLVVNGEKTILNLIPSGVLHPGKVCVLGAGMVIDPEVLVREITALRARGYLAEDRWLRVSDQAHLIMPYHRAIDHARERLREAGAIGTTGRGIGPAYEDKMARTGIRVGDLFDEAGLRRGARRATCARRTVTSSRCSASRRSPSTRSSSEYGGYREQLAPFVADTGAEVRAAVAARRARAARGRAGRAARHRPRHLSVRHLVDLRARRRPSAGAGIPPRMIGRIIGIAKAYTTRVGGGPFPTELRDALGDRLRADGDEYGATTGRPRRCGWFDAVVVRHAVALSGLDAPRAHEARRADRHRPDPRLRRVRDRGQAHRPPAGDPARLGAGDAGLRGRRRAGRTISGTRARSTSCRRRRGATSIGCRRLVEAPVALVSIGAGREQTIRLGDVF